MLLKKWRLKKLSFFFFFYHANDAWRLIVFLYTYFINRMIFFLAKNTLKKKFFSLINLLYIHNSSKVLWVFTFSYIANRLACFCKKKNERTACTHRKSAFFLLHSLLSFLLIFSSSALFACYFFFKLHFAFHSPRNVLFLDTFRMYVSEYIWRNFCALYFGCVFSSNFTFFFCLLYSIQHSDRFACISYSSWFVISLFSLFLRYWLHCSVLWLCLDGERKKKVFFYFAFTDFFVLFLFFSFFFLFLKFANFFISFTHSIAYLLSSSPPPLPTLLI